MTVPTSSFLPRPDEQSSTRVLRFPVARIGRHLVSASTRRRLPSPSTSCAPATLPYRRRLPAPSSSSTTAVDLYSRRSQI
uniref:Uncharacterized protein n=1 Tax=Hordeum vulgare subsp. vulgare TaxID=112509 RepID=A0A8I7B3W7_HORVV